MNTETDHEGAGRGLTVNTVTDHEGAGRGLTVNTEQVFKEQIGDQQ